MIVQLHDLYIHAIGDLAQAPTYEQKKYLSKAT